MPAGALVVPDDGGRFEPTDLTLIRCLRDRVNPGKKSSKFNQDCMICASCREAVVAPVVLEKRENRLEKRESGGTIGAVPPGGHLGRLSASSGTWATAGRTT